MSAPTLAEIRQVLYDFAVLYLQGADSLDRGCIALASSEAIQALYAEAVEKAAQYDRLLADFRWLANTYEPGVIPSHTGFGPSAYFQRRPNISAAKWDEHVAPHLKDAP